MPRINRIFPYVENGWYHIYSRGVNKQPVFFEDKDYWVFRKIVRRKIREMAGLILVDTYCLLDTHFHFRYFQKQQRDITEFMRSIMIRYGLYLRKKYSLTGQQFEGSFRAVYLRTEAERERVREYILRNPIEAGLIGWKHVGTKI